MIVILNIKVTGSAEMIVTAGSSTDKRVIIARYLGRTVGDVLKDLLRKGYELSFVTDRLFVCTKARRKHYKTGRKRNKQITLFNADTPCVKK